MLERATGLELLARKLELHTTIPAADRAALLGLPSECRHVSARAALYRSTDLANHCCILIDGYAARSKLLRDGSRQIVALLLPGDLFGVQRTLFRHADHEIEMLTKGSVAVVAASHIKALIASREQLARALWREALRSGAIQREWTVNVGRRSATERLAHLLCELGVRHEQQGLSRRDAFELPLTQVDLADCTGLTSVHVNRVLRSLTVIGLVGRKPGRTTIADWGGLVRLAGFEEQYLLGESVETSPRFQEAAQ